MDGIGPLPRLSPPFGVASSSLKSIPDQEILANGQKNLKLSPKISPKVRAIIKDAGDGKKMNPARRLRSITLTASAPQLLEDIKPAFLKERENTSLSRGRERSYSEPLLFKSIDEIWNEVDANWQEVSAQKGRLISILYMHGVPNQRRGHFWDRLSHLIPNTELLTCSKEEDEGPTHRCLYKRLLELKGTPHEHQIMADITRTFPSEKSIYAPTFQQSLFNVLKAFSLYDEHVGYCQGLSFVAALLLMHVKEEPAFFMLMRVLKGHNLRSFYTVDMRGVRLRMFQMNKIAKSLFPTMHQHMEELGVNIAVVTTPWFMTAFGYQLPLDVALRVTDVLLVEGIPAFFRIALAILMMCEKDIMALGVDDIMDYFRSDLRDKFKDPQDLMNTALTVNVSLSQLENLEYEFLQNELTADKVESEFDKKSAEQIEAIKGMLQYSQVLIDSHESKERLIRKSREHEELAKQFEQYQKKVEIDKISLVEKLGKLLDKCNTYEAHNKSLVKQLSTTEDELNTLKALSLRLSQCNGSLAQEIHRLKRVSGEQIKRQLSGDFGKQLANSEYALLLKKQAEDLSISPAVSPVASPVVSPALSPTPSASSSSPSSPDSSSRCI